MPDSGEPVAFKRGELTGLALPSYVELDVVALPWNAAAQKQPLPEGVALAKRSQSRLVLSTTINDEQLYIKRGIPRSWKHKLSVRLQGTKLRREWDVARDFLRAGVMVPEPVYYAEDAKKRSYLATRAFPSDWLPIDQQFKHHGIDESILDDLARFTKWLHEIPAYHDDYRSDHIYLTNAKEEATVRERFALLDLDGAFVGRRVTQAKREEALYELFLSLARRGITEAQAARFGQVYGSSIDAVRIFKQADADFHP